MKEKHNFEEKDIVSERKDEDPKSSPKEDKEKDESPEKKA